MNQFNSVVSIMFAGGQLEGQLGQHPRKPPPISNMLMDTKVLMISLIIMYAIWFQNSFFQITIESPDLVLDHLQAECWPSSGTVAIHM